MPEDDAQYEFKTIQTIRGLEAHTRAKWEKGGWEFVEQIPGSMLRSKLSFRRPKKHLAGWVWVAGGGVVAAIAISIVIGTVTESSTHVPTAASTESDAGSIPISSKPTDTAIQSSATASATDADVLEAFNSYLRELASSGVMVAKTVSNVTFSNGIVRVTFDPAMANISQEQFDQFTAFPNLARFVATPIAFSDDLGNRIRPMVDSIETVSADGSPLGTFSRADILALNGLTK